jgi:hypothetical protein
MWEMTAYAAVWRWREAARRHDCTRLERLRLAAVMGSFRQLCVSGLAFRDRYTSEYVMWSDHPSPGSDTHGCRHPSDCHRWNSTHED